MSSELPSPNEEHDDLSDRQTDVQDEFSLDQLSMAYAQVMREQGQLVDPAPDELPSSEKTEPADSQNNSDTARQDSKVQKTLDEIDADDNAGCPISPKSIVEAILFVGAPAGVNLSGRKLAAAMRDVSPKEIKKIVKELNNDYVKQNSSFLIVEDSGDFKMKLRDDLIEVQNHFFGRNRPARLSQNAIDVLALVAYNQPVNRNQVDKIRSRPSGSVLTQLLRRGLIESNEDSQSKTAQFQTTDRFLELFGLSSIEDLPQTSVISDLEELRDV